MLQAKEFLPNTSKNMLRYRKRTKNLLVKVAIYFILINLAFVFLYPFLQVFVRSHQVGRRSDERDGELDSPLATAG